MERISPTLTARTAELNEKLVLELNFSGTTFELLAQGEAVKVRLTRETAMKLADLIDKEFGFSAPTQLF